MSLWEKGSFLLIMLLTLAIADAPVLAQWIHHRFVEDTAVLTEPQN
ncbi:MAG TPA: hypothetical protein V6C65_04930 [Allocoleopsis sp.]